MVILPILTASLIHFSLRGWENVFFELGYEKVNAKLWPYTVPRMSLRQSYVINGKLLEFCRLISGIRVRKIQLHLLN